MSDVIRIVVDASSAVREASKAERAMRGLGAGTERANNALTRFDGVAGGLGRNLRAVGLAAGGIAAIGLGALARAAFNATREYQRLNAMLVTAEGSQTRASASMARLVRFASSTPFSLNQTTEAYIKLRNLGLDASERAMRSFGNTAASMGTSMMQFVEAVADAATGEFERLKEYGIKTETVGNKVRLTFRGVTTEVGKNAREITEYLTRIGEVQFAGAMDRQARTLNGVLSNLGDTWNQLLIKFGQGFADEMFDAVQRLSGSIGDMSNTATSAGQAVGTAVGTIVGALQWAAEHGRLLGAVVTMLGAQVLGTILVRGAGQAVIAITAMTNAYKLANFQAAMHASIAGTAAVRGAGAFAMLATAGRGVAAIFGGPLGIAIAGVAAGMYIMNQRVGSGSQAADDLRDAHQQLQAVLADSTATNTAIGNAVALANQHIRTAQAARQEAIDQLRLAEARIAAADAAAASPDAAEGGAFGSQVFGAQARGNAEDLRGRIATLERQINGAQSTIEADAQTRRIFGRSMSSWVASITEGTTPRGAGAGSGNSNSRNRDNPPTFAEMQEADMRNNLYNSANRYRGYSESRNRQELRELIGHDPVGRFNAWCASFVNAILAQNGLVGTNSRMARSFLNYGTDASSNPQRGDIVVSRRGNDPNAGHVGFLQSIDRNGNAVVLGGNTSNGVGTMTVNRSDILGIRRAPGQGESAADAARAAEDRLRAQNEYWQGLEREVELSRLSTQQAEEHNALLAMRNAYGTDWLTISDEDRKAHEQRVIAAQREIALNRIANEARQNNDNAERELAFRQRTLGMSERQIAVETAAWEIERQALERGLELTDKKLQLEIARARVIAGQNFDLQEQNRLMERAAELRERYRFGDPESRAGMVGRATFERDRDLGALGQEYLSRTVNAAMSGDVSRLPEIAREYERTVEGVNAEFDRAMRDIAERFNQDMLSAIGDIADGFSEIFGDAVGEAIGGVLTAIQAVASGINPRNNPVSNIFGGLQDMTDTLTQQSGMFNNLFGKNGTFIKNLSGAFQNLGIGAAIGDAIAPIGKMIWGQFNSTGAQLGGALGNLAFGPIGGILGSIGGGVLGGLITGPKKGQGTITIGPDGQLQVSASGKGDARKAGEEMSAKVVSGIYDIAKRLGASIGGAPKVSIGMRGDSYRVDPLGRGQTKAKGVVAFKDADSAIQFAIRDAIKDGVLVGLSAFSDKLLKNAKNLDSAVSLAESYENIIKALALIDDPVGGPIKQLNKEFESLRKQMVANGATTADLANVDRYYQHKRKEVLEDAMSDLQGFAEKLRGPGSGVSGLNRLNRMMMEFSAFEADIAAGKQVDQSKFTSLGSNIFDLAGELYGTATSQFQSIRGRLSSANEGAMANVQKVIDTNTQLVTAVTDQTQYLMDGNNLTNVSNGFLQRILEQLEIQNSGGNSGGGDAGFVYGGRNSANQIV